MSLRFLTLKGSISCIYTLISGHSPKTKSSVLAAQGNPDLPPFIFSSLARISSHPFDSKVSYIYPFDSQGFRVLLSPERPVESAVLDRFGDVTGFDRIGTGKVSDRTGHLEDAVMSSGAQTLLRNGTLEQVFGFRA